ncbi:MAG: alpha-L-arabinofuranosidase C-terminal domain-containing protein, partial [Thermoguttaceae bacterium]
RDANSFGTDEFIELCRRVGAEPIIVVNAGTPGWNERRDAKLVDVDWPQEAADWVEYCNGNADSKWGKIRAENGHPAPFNVKYWEIDNETQGANKVENYIEMIQKMVPPMKAVDPSIKIAVAGSHYGPRIPWDQPIIDQAGNLFDYISFHQYDDPKNFADGPEKIGNYFRELKDVISKSKNPNIKIFDSEWNAQTIDWRTGLYAGGLLNEFERCGDILEIGGPALFLRHNSATAWDNAFINFDNRGWFPAPNYVVMKLWRDHFAPNFIAITGQTKGLNVVATKSQDGTIFTVKGVNPTETAKNITVSIDGITPKSALFEMVVAESLDIKNSLEKPDAICVQSGQAEIAANGKEVHFTLPPLSAGVVVIQ